MVATLNIIDGRKFSWTKRLFVAWSLTQSFTSLAKNQV